MADSSKLSTYKMYTIGWIAALDKELTAALAMLDETHEQPDDFEQNDKDSNTYSWGRNGEHNIVIASLGGGSYGKVSAATTATCMATSFPHLRFGLLVGIGAGIPRLEQDIDIRLGDVVVSVPTGGHPGVVQYDLGKKRDNGRLEQVGALNRPPEILLSGVNKLRGHQRLKGSKLPQILKEAVRLHPMLGKPKGKDPPFIHQGSQHDRLFESTSMHVETGHGGIQSHSPQPNEVSRNLPQLMYYELRLTLVWLWTLVYFLLTARKPLDPDVNVIHQETTVARSCLNCDPKKEISRESRQTDDPEIHYGNIASGDLVVKGGLARDLIIQSLGNGFLCFEMEAAGLMNNFPCLVIRGICDYADSHKNDRWQNYAALAAAAYAKELLGAIDARNVERADKMEKIMAEVSDTKQAVQSMNDERLLEKMYAWLSAPDPSVNYHTALSQRHTGTCDWFLHSGQYDRWKRESASSLWIYGGPGCGKTILSSVIINDLEAFENDTQHLLYFFFSFTDSKKQSLDGVVRSLINQLSRKSKGARAYLTSTYSSKYEIGSEQPSTAQLCEIFECMLQRSSNIWVLLDALDECQLGSSFKNEGLLSWLQSLRAPKHGNSRILVTSRQEYDIRVVLERCIPDQLGLQGDLVAGDIEAFIDEAITKWNKKIGWPEHEWAREEIRTYLMKNSAGMFRWVSCQLEALDRLKGCPDHEILKETLESLPKTLDEIYARILEKIPEVLHAKANRILQFLLHSETPLYLKEIVEIAAFSPKSGRSKRRLHNSIKKTKDEISLYCSHLVQFVVVIDKFTGSPLEVLQLAHCSVKEFLLSGLLEQSMSLTFQPQFASGSMAIVCLSYLLDIEHDQPLDQILSSYPLAVYAASFWTQYAKLADTSMVLGHIQKFIHREDCYKTYCQLLAIQYEEHFKFPRRSLWIPPLYLYESAKKIILSMSMLEHFVLRDLRCAVEKVLQKDANAIDANGAYFGNALEYAAYQGEKELVCLLLGAGANPKPKGGGALRAAASKGHQEVMQVLISAGANPNVQGVGLYGNSLAAAIAGNHRDAVEMLLDANADINGHCVFYTAATHADIDIIELLFRNGATVDEKALCAAVKEGRNREVIKTLVGNVTPTASIERCIGTALSVACLNNRLDLVQLLLDAGANVNVPTAAGDTALYVAAVKGLESMFELFLDKAYTTRQQDCIPDSSHHDTSFTDCINVKHLMPMEEYEAKRLLGNALVGSSSPGSRAAAKLLFETCQAYHQAMQRQPDLNRALGSEIQAVKKGCEVEVKSLLDQGANPNALPLVSSQPALYYLIESNEFEDKETFKKIIELLIDYGADTTRDLGRGCALDVALRERRWELVGILRDRGVEKTQMYRFMEAKVDRELRRLQGKSVQG